HDKPVARRHAVPIPVAPAWVGPRRRNRAFNDGVVVALEGKTLRQWMNDQAGAAAGRLDSHARYRPRTLGPPSSICTTSLPRSLPSGGATAVAGTVDAVRRPRS